MIKRNGVAVMNQRTSNVSIARETIAILKAKRYTALNGNVVDISKALDFAIDWTTLYAHNVIIPEPEQPHPIFTTLIEVTNETTAQAAVRWIAEGKTDIVALNFASARNQGGGFLSGAIAQEEDLCRCSGLYACLKRKPQFYNENILIDDSFYTDGIIYSPKVPFFRNEYNLFLEEPFELSIVSAPAPNLRAIQAAMEPQDLTDVLYEIICRRAKKVLQVAALEGHKNIILGAWGCGAFGNDPKQVATIFVELVKKDFPHFENVCFAIYDNRAPPTLFNTFREVMDNY